MKAATSDKSFAVSYRLCLDVVLVLALGLRVQEHAEEGDASTDGVLCREWVVEGNDAGHDHDHALDAVGDAVCHRSDAREDHVGQLLIGMEADAS